MRVVVLGGYGVFGSRLSELLIRDGHEVWTAGRDIGKAQTLTARIGGRPLQADREAGPGAIFGVTPDIVVDAAGPFQSYRDDPYRLARLCLEHGADYLDLSDDADFTAGIGALDGEARERGRRLLSGVSSVPALSSAAVAELARGCDEILLIDTAILPGNRAPRGLSVIASIVGQLGARLPVWRGGMWREARVWSGRRRIRLGPDMRRTGYLIGVPDLVLFPRFFGARSVLFRAGMELRLLNGAMAALALIRCAWPFAMTPTFTGLVKRLADLLLPFGTDRGGMRVAVTARRGEAAREHEWRLVAEAGDGPYVPGVAVRALLRRLDRVHPGARPCLAEFTLAEAEAAMADLRVTTARQERERPTLFQSVLRERWFELPQEQRALHSVQDVESFSGLAQVTRGCSAAARLAAWLFGFPAEGDGIPVTVTKTRTEKGETWERNFGGRRFRSFCAPAGTPYRYREQFWLFDYELELPVENGSMRLPVRRGWLLGIPLPKFLLPRSDSREYVAEGVFHFDVALGAPLGGGLIVRYRGWLKPDRQRLDVSVSARRPQPDAAHGLDGKT